jgi:hypothetical protein
VRTLPRSDPEPRSPPLAPGQGDYESIGAPVGPTKLLPMKTPLSRDILADWQLPQPPRHSLTIEELLAGQAAAGRRVGCIVDLSNHGVGARGCAAGGGRGLGRVGTRPCCGWRPAPLLRPSTRAALALAHSSPPPPPPPPPSTPHRLPVRGRPAQ